MVKSGIGFKLSLVLFHILLKARDMSFTIVVVGMSYC